MTTTLLPLLSAPEVEGWIAAALANAAALHRSDRRLFSGGDDPDQLRQAEQLHAEWTRWIEEATQVRDRAMALPGYHAGLHDLRYEIGIAKAFVQVTPAEHAEREHLRREGKTKFDPFDPAEVRRELQLLHRP